MVFPSRSNRGVTIYIDLFLTFFSFLQVHLQETGGRGVLSVAASGFQLASRGGRGGHRTTQVQASTPPDRQIKGELKAAASAADPSARVFRT